MLSKEEIEDMKDNLKNLHHMLGKEPSISKDTIENALQYIEQLETKEQKLIETNDKYLQKLVYALTPTTHELSTDNNNAFKRIIADNIDLETCKIRRKLKEFWGVNKY